MFTVIVPLYNKEHYIFKCVQSILSQTFANFELIIINDGSTDNSLKVVEELNDERIRIVTQQNAGVSAARNSGAKMAKYEYLAFIDADDWWDIHFLEGMKGLIEKHPDAGIFGSNFYIFKSGVKHASTVGLDKTFKEGYIDYCKVYASTFCVPINCSFVVLSKAAFLAEKGFKEQLKFGEDVELWLRMTLKYKVAYLNEYLSYSNQDADTTNRALGSGKFYSKESHYIFNLSDLEPFEKKNEQLKKLMDGLRVRSLLRFYLSRKYVVEVKQLLSKVNFSLQPAFYRLIYRIPIPIIKFYFTFMRLGASVKKAILSATLTGKKVMTVQ